MRMRGVILALYASTAFAEPRNTVLVDFESLPQDTQCPAFTNVLGVTLSGGFVEVERNASFNTSQVYKKIQSLSSWFCSGPDALIRFDQPASQVSFDLLSKRFKVLTIEGDSGWSRTINMELEGTIRDHNSLGLAVEVPSEQVHSLRIRDHCDFTTGCSSLAAFSLDNLRFRRNWPCLEISGTNGVEPNDRNYSLDAVFIGISVQASDCDGNPIDGIEVLTRIRPVDGSGGHSHEVVPSALRPAGGLRANGTSGIGTEFIVRSSDPNGEIKLEFVPPEISGQYLITAECVSIDCFESEPPLEILVSVPGLRPIPGDSEFYTLKEYLEGTERGKNIGNNGKHDDENHFLTESAATALQNLAINYARFFDNLYVRVPEKLHINDASLPLGGLFDFTGSWNRPHNRHRRGTVVDVRANNTCVLGPCPGAIPRQYRPLFEDVAARLGIIAEHENPDRSNEHYHVLLMGAQE